MSKTKDADRRNMPNNTPKPPPPFMKCHLAMLRALHAQSDDINLSPTDPIWNEIALSELPTLREEVAARRRASSRRKSVHLAAISLWSLCAYSSSSYAVSAGDQNTPSRISGYFTPERKRRKISASCEAVGSPLPASARKNDATDTNARPWKVAAASLAVRFAYERLSESEGRLCEDASRLMPLRERVAGITESLENGRVSDCGDLEATATRAHKIEIWNRLLDDLDYILSDRCNAASQY